MVQKPVACTVTTKIVSFYGCRFSVPYNQNRGAVLNLYQDYFPHEITRTFFFRSASLFWVQAFVLCIVLIVIVYTSVGFVLRLHETGAIGSRASRIRAAGISNFFNWIFAARVPLLSGTDKLIHVLYTAALSVFAVLVLSFLAHSLMLMFPLFPLRLLSGIPYLVWTSLRAFANVLLLTAVGIDIFRRAVLNIPGLSTDRRVRMFFTQVLLFVLSGTIAEAARIALSGQPPFEQFNFLAWPLSYPLSAIPQSGLERAHDVSRLIEYSLLIMFVAGFASGRAYQTLLPMVNICKTKRSLTRGDNYPSAAAEDYRFSNGFSIGASHPDDLSAKEKLSLASCIACGNCQRNCPAWTSGQVLSPMFLVQKMARAVREGISFADAGLIRDEIDACFSCNACMESCPSLIEHVPLITRLRTHYTSTLGSPTATAQGQYRNLHFYGSLSGVHTERRWEWLSRQNYIKTIEEQPDCDYLLFTGCTWLDPSRHRELLKFVEIAALSGLKISTFAHKEGCCGDPALRSGNQLLFKQLALRNMRMFADCKIRKILVLCPHGFSTLDKEYRALYASLSDHEKRPLSTEYQVILYTEFFSRLGREGRLNLKDMRMHATIHDPCYPARQDTWYRPVRELLDNIPGTFVTEMRRTREHSFCCGMSGALGSGDYRFYGEASEYRARDAISTGADTIVTSCQFCRAALSEALLSIDEDKITVKSLIEIVHESHFGEAQPR